MSKDLEFFFNTIGSLISLAFYLLMIPPLQSSKKTRKFDEISYLNLILSHICAICWFCIGVISNDYEISIPNLIFAWLSSNYIYEFYKIGLGRTEFLKTYTIVTVLSAISMLLILPQGITEFAGIIVYILFCAAPLEQLRPTFETRNPRFIDIYSTFAALLCCLSYFMYSIIAGNIVVLIPNLAGIIFALIQIIVYFWAKRMIPSSFISPLLKIDTFLSIKSSKNI
ncbi:unnamed protein product [Blepharisma stoltei]|uniref:Sugar transporter SWEET n=1 Tax=Blepharisma stoltei TaxID=1481888 RepID=A0AAU9JU52_9CILI|nr:unnamed protein product [Blepharisma stoltei]